MKREIKFRAWDKRNKEWLFDFRIHPEGTVMKVVGEKGGKWQYSTEVSQNIELGQFTGLHDKHGKEIWELDLLKKDGIVYKVFFERGAFWVAQKEDEEAKYKFALCDLLKDKVEVIGNIYEHSNLLGRSHGRAESD